MATRVGFVLLVGSLMLVAGEMASAQRPAGDAAIVCRVRRHRLSS